MAASDWLIPVAIAALLLKARSAQAAPPGGNGYTPPSAAAIAGSAGPEVFAGVPTETAIAMLPGGACPSSWSYLDCYDFMHGY